MGIKNIHATIFIVSMLHTLKTTVKQKAYSPSSIENSTKMVYLTNMNYSDKNKK